MGIFSDGTVNIRDQRIHWMQLLPSPVNHDDILYKENYEKKKNYHEELSHLLF